MNLILNEYKTPFVTGINTVSAHIINVVYTYPRFCKACWELEINWPICKGIKTISLRYNKLFKKKKKNCATKRNSLIQKLKCTYPP